VLRGVSRLSQAESAVFGSTGAESVFFGGPGSSGCVCMHVGLCPRNVE
jgi:hypothetical protein